MNRSGFNSAAINSTAIRVIAGAAIVTCSFTAQSSGLKTQYGTAVASSQSISKADGTRIQSGEAIAVSALTGSAKWALLTLAEAKVSINLAVRAVNTEAYAGITTQISATGTAIRNAAAVCTAKAMTTADASVTVGYAANVLISSDATADASVQPAGSSNWYRDGYIKPITVKSTASATALRTALATASVVSTSSATADAVRTQGGAATCAVALYAEATGASDTAWCNVSAQTSATGIITRFGEAFCQGRSSISVFDTVIRPGQAEPVTVCLATSVDGRLAHRGEAIAAGNLVAIVDGRLALIGSALIPIKFTTAADGVVYKVGAASLAVNLSTSADGYIIRLGEAKASVSLIASADGATNLQARASTERTMDLPFDDRGMVVPLEDRSMRLV